MALIGPARPEMFGRTRVDYYSPTGCRFPLPLLFDGDADADADVNDDADEDGDVIMLKSASGVDPPPTSASLANSSSNCSSNQIQYFNWWIHTIYCYSFAFQVGVELHWTNVIRWSMECEPAWDMNPTLRCQIKAVIHFKIELSEHFIRGIQL